MDQLLLERFEWHLPCLLSQVFSCCGRHDGQDCFQMTNDVDVEARSSSEALDSTLKPGIPVALEVRNSNFADSPANSPADSLGGLSIPMEKPLGMLAFPGTTCNAREGSLSELKLAITSVMGRPTSSCGGSTLVAAAHASSRLSPASSSERCPAWNSMPQLKIGPPLTSPTVLRNGSSFRASNGGWIPGSGGRLNHPGSGDRGAGSGGDLGTGSGGRLHRLGNLPGSATMRLPHQEVRVSFGTGSMSSLDEGLEAYVAVSSASHPQGIATSRVTPMMSPLSPAGAPSSPLPSSS